MRDSEPTIEDVIDAARRLRGIAVVTPLLRSEALDEAVGGTLLVKAEPLQRTGSFKIRGAYNRISRIPDGDRAKGVVSWSSGNHAQGVAAAAGLLGIPATIVMPSDTPAPKLDNTRRLGAEVVLYDRYTESREEIGTRIAAQGGATVVKPYDDPWIIAGQGTVGLEAAAQALALGFRPDHAVCACSGGGLISGCAIALTDHLPGVTVHSVEPEGFDDTARSLAAGKRVANDPAARSICDALLAPTPGELTFSINRRLLGAGVAVSDAAARAAMRAAFRHLRIVVEPGGAVPLAAVLSGKLDCRGKVVLVVLSGGNVAPELFAETLAERRTGG